MQPAKPRRLPVSAGAPAPQPPRRSTRSYGTCRPRSLRRHAAHNNQLPERSPAEPALLRELDVRRLIVPGVDQSVEAHTQRRGSCRSHRTWTLRSHVAGVPQRLQAAAARRQLRSCCVPAAPQLRAHSADQTAALPCECQQSGIAARPLGRPLTSASWPSAARTCRLTSSRPPPGRPPHRCAARSSTSRAQPARTRPSCCAPRGRRP